MMKCQRGPAFLAHALTLFPSTMHLYQSESRAQDHLSAKRRMQKPESCDCLHNLVELGLIYYNQLYILNPTASSKWDGTQLLCISSFSSWQVASTSYYVLHHVWVTPVPPEASLISQSVAQSIIQYVKDVYKY
ncbi:hypothetical protein GGU11DRAFT_773129, partial [Lentinula aff. detonsa]